MKAEKGKLFGFGIIMYGFIDLLARHPKDFIVLLGHVTRDYLFEEYRPVSASSVMYVDTELDTKIIPRPGALISYLSFIPFLIGNLGFLKWHFGNRVRSDVCLFMREVKDLYSDAGYVFRNSPTRLKYRVSPGIGLKILHFFDRPRNCFPSLHVILASYSYLKTKELIGKYSVDHRIYSRDREFLRDWSSRIIESCLLTKQHSLRDIAGGLALVSAKCPQFSRQDIDELVGNILLKYSGDEQKDYSDMARKEIVSSYSKLVSTESHDIDRRDVLVSYVRSI